MNKVELEDFWLELFEALEDAEVEQDDIHVGLPIAELEPRFVPVTAWEPTVYGATTYFNDRPMGETLVP